MLKDLRTDMTGSFASACPIHRENREAEVSFDALAEVYNRLVRATPEKKILRIPKKGTTERAVLYSMMEEAVSAAEAAKAAQPEGQGRFPRMTTPNQRAKMGYDAP
jgi:hypothetical protein